VFAAGESAAEMTGFNARQVRDRLGMAAGALCASIPTGMAGPVPKLIVPLSEIGAESQGAEGARVQGRLRSGDGPLILRTKSLFWKLLLRYG